MQALNNLSLRERLILIFAIVALLSLSLHAFVWEPLIEDTANYQEQLEEEKDDLLWIQQNIGQLKKTSIKTKAIKGSLISWLDLQVKKNQLKDHLKRIKPRGEKQVKIWLEDVNAKFLIQFLENVTQYTIVIDEIKLVALDELGKINATIILENQ